MPPIANASQRQLLEEIVERFERAWHDRKNPSIEEYLNDSPVPRSLLLPELVHTDLEYRLKAGDGARLEDYLQRFPELKENREAVVDLILAECRHRRHQGEQTTWQDYLPRFSEYESELEEQASLHSQETAVAAPPPSALPAYLPPRVGRYRLEKEIDRGGMGAIIRVQDEDFQRPLVMKVLRDKYRGHAEMEDRFFKEARLTGQLQHPGIPPVQEMGRLEDGRPYFIMKLVKGQTLAALLKDRASGVGSRASVPDPRSSIPDPRSPTPDPRFLSIFEHICQTLGYAHSRHIIHRDLKPGNIMVGAFGEVQVMDWGLAKVLDPASGEFEREQAATDASSTIFLVQSGSADSDATAAGSVMGTPAYMAPEQARGEVNALDQRSDVFGLGAILCEILTGKPPFAGENSVEVQRRSRRGDLTDACARLDGCEVDAELIELAKHCLAPEQEDRPAHAGEVARAVADYQARVQERLHQAEVEEAAAKAKAREERKRRRITVALAALALIFVGALAAGGLWYSEVSSRAEQKLALTEKEIADSIRQVEKLRKDLDEQLRRPGGVFELLDDPSRWEGQIQHARSLLKHAKALYSSNQGQLHRKYGEKIQQLESFLAKDDDNRRLAMGLERMRDRFSGSAAKTLLQQPLLAKHGPSLSAMPETNAASEIAAKEPAFSASGQVIDPIQISSDYQQFFQNAGLDLVKDKPAVLAKRIEQSAIKEQLVSALEDWALVVWETKPEEFEKKQQQLEVTKDQLVIQLLEVARLVDPHPWRDRVRDPANWNDRETLEALAKKELSNLKGKDRLSPQILVLLGKLLHSNKSAAAQRWLQKAQQQYPSDYWLNMELGIVLEEEEPMKALQYLRAALAVRPQSFLAYNAVGVALYNAKLLDEAEFHLRKSISLNPKCATGHNNLGKVLYDKNDREGAIKHWQQASRLDPSDFRPQNNLGLAFYDKNELERAIQHYKKAQEIKPDSALVHNGFGYVLYKKGDLGGAVKHYKKAIEIDPEHTRAYINLGHAMRDLKDHRSAVKYFKKVIEIDSNHYWGHYNLGLVYDDTNDLNLAIDHFEIASQIKPDEAWPLYELGRMMFAKNDLEGAIKYYEQAIQLKPDFAWAYNNLGYTLFTKGDLHGAIKHYKKAIQFDPDYALAHNNLGHALYTKDDLGGAFKHYKKAIELNPNNAQAHVNLGIALRAFKDLGGAIKHCQKAIQINPDHPGGHYELGLAFFDQNDFENAARHFQEMIRINPKDEWGYYELGRTLFAKYDLEGAIECYKQAIQLKSNFAWAHNNLGHTLYTKDDLDGAIKHYQKAIEINPGYALAHNNLGNALRDKDDLYGAIKHYQKAIESDPNYAWPHYNLGDVFFDKKDFDRAIKCYREAIRINPKLASAHTNLGILLRVKNDLEGAIKHFQKAIHLDPSQAEAHNNLANALGDQNDLDGAIKHYHEAIRINPKFAAAHSNLAKALYEKKDVAGAFKHYRESIKLDPSRYLPYDKLSQALIEQKQYAEAKKVVQQALEQFPAGHPQHELFIKRLKECERKLSQGSKRIRS